MRFPDELWAMILKVNKRRAIRERLGAILDAVVLPKPTRYDIAQYKWVSGSHQWMLKYQYGRFIGKKYYRLARLGGQSGLYISALKYQEHNNGSMRRMGRGSGYWVPRERFNYNEPAPSDAVP